MVRASFSDRGPACERAQGFGASEKDPIMRFTRFPRGGTNPPSARRVAAAKRAVQAEKDRYPLFPELVTHHTPEVRLAAIDRHRIEWWQEHRNFRAERWREARSSLRALPPGPRTAIMRYWQKAFLPGDATYLLGLIRDHKVRKRCFWHALAELRRLNWFLKAACPTLGNAHNGLWPNEGLHAKRNDDLVPLRLALANQEYLAFDQDPHSVNLPATDR
jgi:hypothetical protein